MAASGSGCAAALCTSGERLPDAGRMFQHLGASSVDLERVGGGGARSAEGYGFDALAPAVRRKPADVAGEGPCGRDDDSYGSGKFPVEKRGTLGVVPAAVRRNRCWRAGGSRT